MIKAGYELHTGNGAVLQTYPWNESSGSVCLKISKGYVWDSADIKELRKFLKKLQKQLEGRVVDE